MIYLQQELGRAWVCLPLGISLGLRPREIPRGRQTQALPRSCRRYIPFLTYLDDLQSIELKIRRGIRIFSVKDKQIINKDMSQIRDLDENTTMENEHLVDTNKHIDEIQHNDGDNIDQDSMNSDNRSSKYAGLVFKECVRTKGRPRSKRTKQVTFNKTALDRQPKAKKIKTKVPEIENSSSESEGVDDIIYDDSNDDVSDRDESQD